MKRVTYVLLSFLTGFITGFTWYILLFQPISINPAIGYFLGSLTTVLYIAICYLLYKAKLDDNNKKQNQ